MSLAVRLFSSVQRSVVAGAAALGLAGGLLAPAPALASIVYSVDFQGLTGTVTTDGTFGALGASNILTFSFDYEGFITYEFGSVTCGSPSCLLSADASGLYLDYSSAGSISFIDTPGGERVVFLSLNDGLGGANNSYYNDRGGRALVVFSAASPITFGTSVSAAVPEPGMLGLVGAGLLGLWATRRRLGG